MDKSETTDPESLDDWTVGILGCEECPIVTGLACQEMSRCPRRNVKTGEVAILSTGQWRIMRPDNEAADVIPTVEADGPESGVKYDGGKAMPIRGCVQYFPRATLAIGELSQRGAEKYSWDGWRHVLDGFNRYTEAMGRHLIEESFGELDDGDGGTGMPHIVQVAWNALARLEIYLEEKENGK
jgi:hypothetical protein